MAEDRRNLIPPAQTMRAICSEPIEDSPVGYHGNVHNVHEVLGGLAGIIRSRATAGRDQVSVMIPSIPIHVLTSVRGVLEWMEYGVEEKSMNVVGDRPGRRKLDVKLTIRW